MQYKLYAQHRNGRIYSSHYRLIKTFDNFDEAELLAYSLTNYDIKINNQLYGYDAKPIPCLRENIPICPKCGCRVGGGYSYTIAFDKLWQNCGKCHFTEELPNSYIADPKRCCDKSHHSADLNQSSYNCYICGGLLPKVRNWNYIKQMSTITGNADLSTNSKSG